MADPEVTPFVTPERTPFLAATPAPAHEIRRRVDAELARLLDQKLLELPDEGLLPWMQTLRSFVLEGGKRMRAIFCYWGFRGAGGNPGAQGMIVAAAALELFQAFLLIQDDIIDRSQLRRGRPTVHRQIGAWKTEQNRSDDADAFGQSAALVMSDLCLGWAWELVSRCTDDPAQSCAIRALFDRMLIDVYYGQGLELFLMADQGFTVKRGLTVARYKTGAYTVEGPLQIGAALAGASPALQRAFADFGLPAGEAFQLRDDLLGVFGPPDSTGKSNLDDLREGKPTVLVALALEKGSPAQTARLRSLYGRQDLDDAGAEELRELIRATGAAAAVEEMIKVRAQQALGILDRTPLLAEAREALIGLTNAALYRDR